MELRRARLEDIEEVLELHFRYQVDSIKEEDKKDGFVTTAFSVEELSALITQEVCIDKSVRGSGVLEAIFAYALKEMSARYEILITFVNKINPRSFQAHSRKLQLEVIKEFEFNRNYYYTLACSTH